MQRAAFCLLLFLTLSVTVAETPPEEQAAIKSLSGITSNLQKNRDGTVRFVRFSKSIVTDDHLIHVAAFKQLDYLAVVTPGVGDAGLTCLSELTNLDTIFLSDSGVTDRSLERLIGHSKLERIYLDRTAVTDAGLSSLAALSSLTTLSLTGTQVTNAGLQVLASQQNLVSLHLSNTKITDDGLAHLRTLTALTDVSLNGTQVSASGLKHLSTIPTLKHLSLRDVKLSTDAVAMLQLFPGLQSVDLRRTGLGAVDLETLRHAQPSLTVAASPSEEHSRNPLQRYLADERLRRGSAEITSDSGTRNQEAEVVDAVEQIVGSNGRADFQRHVIPLLGRLGCNGRTCHGSFQGKGGFNLSMFGYDFESDLKALTEGDEPRVDRANVASSLILNKPASEDDHGGGQRFQTGGWEYKLLRSWIESGATGTPEPAKLIRFDVVPEEIVFQQPGESVQLTCVAVWHDGTREDVTSLARFQTKDDNMAVVSPTGAVTCVSPGDTHIVSFYDNGICATPVMMPVSELHGPDYPAQETPTEIDRLVVRKLSRLGIVPSDVCSDGEFLRRVSLDLAGTLPSAAEVQAFTANSSANKREQKVDELLQSDAFATWWAVRLADLTGSNSQALGSTDMNSPASDQWNAWLKRRLVDNTGWDRIAAGIILATSRRPGQTWESYAAEQSLHLKKKGGTDYSAPDNPMHYYWFRSNNQSDTDRALTFGYTFMGVRLQCAQCHKHPFDQWSKSDFERFAGFFKRIRTGIAPDARDSQAFLKTRLGVPVKLDTAALRRQMYLRVAAEGLPIPWNEVWIESPPEKSVIAKIPGGDEVDLNTFSDPREPLMEWLVRKDNPYFAPAFVNRVWAHYFGTGIVEPPDDFNMANPPRNRRLLDWLSQEFIAHEFDIQWLHRTIVTSLTYQRSSVTNPSNRTDERNFSRSLVRRLPAETTVDAILRATARDDIAEKYLTVASGRKIGQHPRSFQARGIDYSLLVFGKPRRTTSCDCERQDQPTLLQSLFVRNDTEMLGWLERSDGWLQATAKQLGQPLVLESGAQTKAADKPVSPVFADELVTRELIRNAYLRTLAREPTADELRLAKAHIHTTENSVEGLRDVMWALLNTQEFLTNH